MRHCAGVLLALSLAAGAWAQGDPDSLALRKVERVHLDDVHPGRDGERVVELYLRALTRYGEPVTDVRPVDIVIRDQQERIDPEDVSLQLISQTGYGLSCVIAVDVSKTMMGEPFARARDAALEFLDHLESRDRVAVVAFADEARVVAPFAASRAQARVALEGLGVDDASLGTVLYDGVAEGIGLIRKGPDLPRRSFVIVFSDGSDSGSRRSLEQLIESSQPDENRSPILVFSIGYTRFGGEGFETLRRLSSATGGEFLEASSAIHLNAFFSNVWEQMNQSYVVRYSARMDGAAHCVDVTIEGQTSKRCANYPDLPEPIWPYLAIAGLTVLVGVAVAFVTRRRPAGRVVFVGGPRAGEGIALLGPRTRLGALDDNDLCIPSETVSKYHAVIYRKGRQVEIEDLDSTNGTFVNGTAVRRSPLEPGDRIRLADVDLVFER